MRDKGKKLFKRKKKFFGSKIFLYGSKNFLFSSKKTGRKDTTETAATSTKISGQSVTEVKQKCERIVAGMLNLRNKTCRNLQL